MHLLNIILFGMAILGAPLAGEDSDEDTLLKHLTNLNGHGHAHGHEHEEFNLNSLHDLTAGRNQFPLTLLSKSSSSNSSDSSDSPNELSGWGVLTNCSRNPESWLANLDCANCCLRNNAYIGGHCEDRKCKCILPPPTTVEPTTSEPATTTTSEEPATSEEETTTEEVGKDTTVVAE